VGAELCQKLEDHPEYGLLPFGLVDDVDDEDGLRLVGAMSTLAELIRALGVRRVIVAFGPTGDRQLVPVLRKIAALDVELLVVPRFFELGLAPMGPEVELVWGIPLYRVRGPASRRWSWRTKRLLDIVGSAIGLVIVAPVMAASAIAIKVSMPGPVLFRQRRIGGGGRPFDVLKLRTMPTNSDSDVTWSVSTDPRLTRVGRILRATSIDELPQLWNVLTGDMSLVGPRPERPHFVTRFEDEVPGYAARHRMPVGLTGFAQIHGLRGDTSIVERARFDNYYVEHWSAWTDIKILMRTGAAVVRDAAKTRRSRAAEERESAGAIGYAPRQVPPQAHEQVGGR
jgi:exopolysaccharide biosynthesis polyprenyl glycosylphosphotransferase